jgi:hypothetical protein
MGGGGLMQLVAYGMQDVYLTGNSQITFFKNLYRRHTNFSVEAVQQTFQSNSDNLGNRLVAVISRNGDLLHRLWLEVELPGVPPGTNQEYVSKLGHALIKSAEVEIGGQRIDKIYGRWMELWHHLSCRAEKKEGYELMTGNSAEGNKTQTFKTAEDDDKNGERKLYLPINFWFSKGSAGAALPLIALQYHEVRITIDIASAEEVSRTMDSAVSAASSGTSLKMSSNPKLYSDFFYLDTDERRRFSQMSHEYLVEQLQFTGKETSPEIKTSGTQQMSIRLNFNHPTKAIYFTAEPAGSPADDQANPFYNGHFCGTKDDGTSNESSLPVDNSPIEEVGLMLNGHDRFSVRTGDYFTWVQPYQHHTRVPTKHWAGMYSFCLSPEEHQPSGALNFSRIDNAQLKLTFKKAKPAGTGGVGGFGDHTRDVYVYALSYNVLRILSGMGGLAFSN